MKQSIGSLLLVIGVILAALAAGESQRVSRSASVDAALVGQVLHTQVATHYESEFPDVFVYQDRRLEPGITLEADNVAWMQSLGLEEVLVLRRVAEQETIAVGEVALGRVLAEAVVLNAELEEIQPGRVITAGFEKRLRASDMEFVKVTAERLQEDGGVEREQVLWPLGADAEEPEGLTLEGSKLREVVSLPVQLKVSSYMDPDLLARFQASDLTEVAVKIPKAWKLEDWADRYRFLAGVLLTALGMVLRRSKPGATSLEEGQTELDELALQLVALEGAVERCVRDADGMQAPDLHKVIDPLLTGPVYAIAEGRNSIRKAHGNRVFCAVMDAFSRGERKLNRAWSASVDGHAEESRASLAAALPALREAREALPGTQPPAPVGFATDSPEAPLPPDVPLAGGDDHWANE